jgi:hypothetical protein
VERVVVVLIVVAAVQAVLWLGVLAQANGGGCGGAGRDGGGWEERVLLSPVGHVCAVLCLETYKGQGARR